MSLLAPLYVLGALGIGLPILLHLIRRQPKGKWLFSSLMFLQPTPPTLSRRSRLDNWPLLLLRALALLLLAAAFARPFLRGSLLQPDETIGRRIVVLLDTSASMRRGDLWKQATSKVSELLASLKPRDQLALVSFASTPALIFTFEQSTSLDLSGRQKAVTEVISKLSPGWSTSNLGDALSFGADLLASDDGIGTIVDSEDGVQPKADESPLHLVVISDLQASGESNLASLQSYAWPKSVKVEPQVVSPSQNTNAWITILKPQDEQSGEDIANDAESNTSPNTSPNTSASGGGSVASGRRTRVRVSNASDSTGSDFFLVWETADGKTMDSTRTPVNIGPGQSRIVQMVEPEDSILNAEMMRLVLSGDDHDFDNCRYVLRPKALQQEVVFAGRVEDEPRQSLFYYLKRAPLDTTDRSVSIKTVDDALPLGTLDFYRTPMVVVANEVADKQIELLRQYVLSGGGLLWVLDSSLNLDAAQEALRLLGEAPELTVSAAQPGDYAMWSQIDFKHPLFKPFADTKYNDFTKIRFWTHRVLAGVPASWQSLASFDDGTPALLEFAIGKGRVWVMTSGWQPVDSQLSLSTKFVPLLRGMAAFFAKDLTHNQSLDIDGESPFQPSATAEIERDGAPAIPYRAKGDFASLASPGLYRFVDGEKQQPFAINVGEDESKTQPLSFDDLERMGVAFGPLSDGEQTLTQKRQQRDVELENRQRLWQWLLLAALLMLASESWLSGYMDRRQSRVGQESP